MQLTSTQRANRMDIKDHDFWDDEVVGAVNHDTFVELTLDDCDALNILLSKDDVKALAIHFGLINPNTESK